MSRSDPHRPALLATRLEPIPASWQQCLIETCRQNFDWLTQVSDLEIQRVQSTAFSGTQVFQLNSPELGQFALRLWPTGAMPPERLAGLHALLRHTQQLGLPVAAPVPVSKRKATQETMSCFRIMAASPLWAGSCSASMAPLAMNSSGMNTLGREEEFLCQLEPWLKGQPLDSSNLDESGATKAMAMLARWHTAACSFTSPPSCQAWFAPSHQGVSPTVLKCLAKLTRQVAGLAHRDAVEHGVGGTCLTSFDDFRCLAKLRKLAQLVDDLIPPITRELAPWAHQEVPLTPCWGDFWCQHVLMQHHQVSGLLDATAARTDSVAIDLARFLGSFHTVKPSTRELAFDDYRGVRPLSEIEIRLARVMERVGLLMAGMFWMESLIGKNARDHQSQNRQRWQMISMRLDWLLCRMSLLHV
ncbi:homoserine kinase [Planctopirus ephydatiae]|uniref:Homoserine kinase n=1 Tax=Planctopirus ephydatiae TaxID=2528019 RepID=A0A518GM18_9PLAN|nr:phosphotransferase [Planctopirus ephydatiae]QDV29619.1 homoserine kinase [Planctopirus ephydatiae]